MAGNVWEWIADWYSNSYYVRSERSNLLGPDSGIYRIVRGNAWTGSTNCPYRVYGSVNSYIRVPGELDKAQNNIGFRCAMSANP